MVLTELAFEQDEREPERNQRATLDNGSPRVELPFTVKLRPRPGGRRMTEALKPRAHFV